MAAFEQCVFWFHVISMNTFCFKLFCCAPGHKRKLKNSSVIFVLCLSNQGSIAWIFFFLSLEKILLGLLHGIWFVRIGVVSCKENLQGGLLASEVYYKIIPYIFRYLEIVKYLAFKKKSKSYIFESRLCALPFAFKF